MFDIWIYNCSIFSYAFISYDNNDSAFQALTTLQGTIINGCRCIIEISKASRQNKRLRADRQTNVDINGETVKISKKQMILISDLGDNLNVEYLKLLCNNFGTVIDIVLLPKFEHDDDDEGNNKNKNSK